MQLFRSAPAYSEIDLPFLSHWTIRQAANNQSAAGDRMAIAIGRLMEQEFTFAKTQPEDPRNLYLYLRQNQDHPPLC